MMKLTVLLITLKLLSMYQIRFIEIGDKVDLKVNGAAANNSTWYDIDSTMRITKKDSKLLGEPFDSIKYVSKKDDVISNEALMQINYPPNKNQNPSSVNNQITINKNQTYVLNKNFTFNSSVDRIRIVKFDQNAGELLFNKRPIYIGQEIMIYDLNKLEFLSKNGIGNPYQSLIYKAGNNQKYSTQEYYLRFKIDGKSFLEEPVIKNSITDISASVSIPIKNGVINGKAYLKVKVQTDSIRIFEKGSVVVNELEVIKSGEYFFNVDLNSEGEFNFNIYMSSDEVISDGAIYFNVELISINNDTTIVDQENNKSLIIVNL